MEIKVTTTVKLNVKELKDIIRTHLVSNGIHATDDIKFHIRRYYEQDSVSEEYEFDYATATGYVDNTPTE